MEHIDFNAFFSPKSVALIGASGDPTRIGGKPLHYLLKHKYGGRIYPINPKRKEILGFPCYADVRQVPEDEIDVALISIPAQNVPAAVEASRVKGVRFCVILSAGFGEMGDDGKDREAEILNLVKGSQTRIIGPNCVGCYNVKEGLPMGFANPFDLQNIGWGPISFVSQSGAFGYGLMTLGLERGIKFKYIANTGNELDLDALDFIDFMLEDAETHIIGAYIEGIKDAGKLKRVAQKAIAQQKPLIILKAGISSIGQQAAKSHTGALSGSHQIYLSMCKQFGIINVYDAADMLDIMEFYYKIKKFAEVDHTKGVGILATSGALGVLMADACERYNVSIAKLSERTVQELQAVLPRYGSSLNPVDTTAQILNEPETFSKTLRLLSEDENVGIITCLSSTIHGEIGARVGRAISEIVKEIAKPLVVVLTGGDMMTEEIQAQLKQANVPVNKFCDRVARAVNDILSWRSFVKNSLNNNSIRKSRMDVSLNKWQTVRQSNGLEYHAKEWLKDNGFPVPKNVFCTRHSDIPVALSEIGLPAVLKVQSNKLLHKTEAGGVAFIRNHAEVNIAQEKIDRCIAGLNKADFVGVLVEELISGGFECLIGLRKDPAYGPIMVFGLGGIYTEALRDVSIRTLPLTVRDAETMVKEIKGYSILKGARGKPEADIPALIDFLLTLSEFYTNEKLINLDWQEIDLNPVLVLPRGQGLRILDAGLVFKA